MPRVSSANEQLSGFGTQDGTIQFRNVKFANVQHTKGTGEQTTPKFCFVADIVKLNSDLKAEDYDSDAPENKSFLISWGSKDRMDMSNSPFEPGIAEGPNDADPKKGGREIGTSGNTIYVMSEEEFSKQFPDRTYPPKIGADTDFAILTKNLEKIGFKPEDKYYAPSYEGLIVQVQTVNKEELCKKLKIRFRPYGEGTQTVWEVVKILKQESVSTTEATSTATQAKAGNGSANGEVKDLFAKVAAAVGAKNSGKEVEISKLNVLFMPVMRDLKIPMQDQKKVLEAIKSEAFLAANSDGFIVADGRVAF